MFSVVNKLVLIGMLIAVLGGITGIQGFKAADSPTIEPSFDIVDTNVRRTGNQLVFQMDVADAVGGTKPQPVGSVAASHVYSYVWPTSLKPTSVGFGTREGILALAVTSHPDFDDTPLFDENHDNHLDNDGEVWHTHWVVLVPDPACGAQGLKVQDIPPSSQQKLPKTWPGLPILIDSPGYSPQFNGNKVEIKVPFDKANVVKGMRYDGVTAQLQVNADMKAPLLCVTQVFDIDSGDLSLPGRVE
jgi:hypothetical protein